jgi:hypothetical protein
MRRILMKLEMYQKVIIIDGRRGHIIEIFKDGEAYMVDVKTKDDEYETLTIFPRDIKGIIVEVEQPFEMAV